VLFVIQPCHVYFLHYVLYGIWRQYIIDILVRFNNDLNYLLQLNVLKDQYSNCLHLPICGHSSFLETLNSLLREFPG